MPETDKPDICWTVQTYAAHNEAMRKESQRFEDERDRRYTEVNIEKEKALKIKETADLAALSLARRGTNDRIGGGLTVYCGAETFRGVPSRVLRLTGSIPPL